MAEDGQPALIAPTLKELPAAPLVLFGSALVLLGVIGVSTLGQKSTPAEPTGVIEAISPQDKAALSAAVTKMKLAPDLKADVLHAALAGDIRVGWIFAWDWKDQDGDVVALSGAGYKQAIVITNAPQAVPVPFDEHGAITVEALRDGEGGITVGVGRGAFAQKLRYLAPGERVAVPAP